MIFSLFLFIIIFISYIPSFIISYKIISYSKFRIFNNNNKQYLFNWNTIFKPSNKNITTIDKQQGSSVQSINIPIAKIDKDKINKLKNNLEKISNKQNRNYEEEAIKQQSKVVPLIVDKQIVSFNFNKANEFPNLYKGWIQKEGDQIAKQAISSLKAALNNQVKYMEILFDPVPNLDEVAFGTEWNKRLRNDVVTNLKVPDYAANRGGPSTLEWSNLYWANRLASGALINSKKPNVLLLSLSGEGTKGENIPTFAKGVKLITLNEIKKISLIETFKEQDINSFSAFILLSPCQESHYNDAIKLSDKYNIPVIALNSPYSYRYDIGGGKPFELIYVMKRIPKGWIYRQYPKPFEAIIEGPNYEVFKAQSFIEQPSLPVISKVSTQASYEKYGSIGNDRIFQNRL